MSASLASGGTPRIPYKSFCGGDAGTPPPSGRFFAFGAIGRFVFGATTFRLTLLSALAVGPREGNDHSIGLAPPALGGPLERTQAEKAATSAQRVLRSLARCLTL